MSGIIYIATNKDNGKIYVGQTVNFSKRLNSHLRNKRSFSHFDSALQKYGIDKFSFKKITYSNDSLNYWENYFILTLNSLHPNGYNLMTGGAAPRHSEETKRKISLAITGEKNANFGKPHSEEWNKNIGKGNKGKNIGKGHPQTNETRKKISEAHKGKTVSEETRKKMSNSKKGKYCGANSPSFGRRHTAEAKKKISMFFKGKPWSINRRLAQNKKSEEKNV